MHEGTTHVASRLPPHVWPVLQPTLPPGGLFAFLKTYFGHVFCFGFEKIYLIFSFQTVVMFVGDIEPAVVAAATGPHLSPESRRIRVNQTGVNLGRLEFPSGIIR